MDPKNSNPSGGLNPFVSACSVLSLLGSLWAVVLIVPNIKVGFYGGTAVFVGFIVILQGIVLLLGAILPIAFQSYRRRLRLARNARKLLIIALSGIAIEILALVLIPVTGNC